MVLNNKIFKKLIKEISYMDIIIKDKRSIQRDILSLMIDANIFGSFFQIISPHTIFYR